VSLSARCHTDFQAAGNTPRPWEERENSEEREFPGTCFAAGVEGQAPLFPEGRIVLAETLAIAFLDSTEMKKYTKHF